MTESVNRGNWKRKSSRCNDYLPHPPAGGQFGESEQVREHEKRERGERDKEKKRSESEEKRNAENTWSGKTERK